MNEKENLLRVAIIDKNQEPIIGHLLAKALNGYNVGDLCLYFSNHRDIASLNDRYPLVILVLSHVDDFLTNSSYYLTCLAQAGASAVILLAGNTCFSSPLPTELSDAVLVEPLPLLDLGAFTEKIYTFHQKRGKHRISWMKEVIFPMKLLEQYYHEVIDYHRPFFPKHLERCKKWIAANQEKYGLNLSAEEIENLNVERADAIFMDIAQGEFGPISSVEPQKPAGKNASPVPTSPSLPEPAEGVRRILIVDDEWNKEEFWVPYVAWDTEHQWEFIFADFSLKNFFMVYRGYKMQPTEFNVLDLLFFPTDQASFEADGLWEQLRQEKCFVLLLDNFYGRATDGIELGQLFLDVCVGRNPEENPVWTLVADYLSKSPDIERKELEAALPTIKMIYERCKPDNDGEQHEEFLPKVVLHSAYASPQFDKSGHVSIRKSAITENSQNTRVMLNALYWTGLGHFEKLCYEKGMEKQHIADYGDFKGISEAAQEIYKQLKVARQARDVTVLILGKSGTGKEVLAKEIAKERFLVYLRRLNERLDYNSLEELYEAVSEEKAKEFETLFNCYFKSVNLGAMTTYGNLMQIELFGCQENYPNRGDPEVPSLFEFVPPNWPAQNRSRRQLAVDYVCQVVGGNSREKENIEEVVNEVVVFLDELGEAPSEVQVGLLRLLQEREVTPLPTSQGQRIPVQFKLISATNADLEAFIEQGKFREDLYYRVSDIVIEIPGLAERRVDIPVLVETFIDKWVKAFAIDFWRLPEEAPKDTKENDEELISWVSKSLLPKQFGWDDYNLLLGYDWPGNVRELEQTVKQSLLYTYYKQNENLDFPIVELPDQKRDDMKTSRSKE